MISRSLNGLIIKKLAVENTLEYVEEFFIRFNLNDLNQYREIFTRLNGKKLIIKGSFDEDHWNIVEVSKIPLNNEINLNFSKCKDHTLFLAIKCFGVVLLQQFKPIRAQQIIKNLYDIIWITNEFSKKGLASWEKYIKDTIRLNDKPTSKLIMQRTCLLDFLSFYSDISFANEYTIITKNYIRTSETRIAFVVVENYLHFMTY